MGVGGEDGGWGVWGVWVCVRVRVIALLPGQRPGVCVIAMRPACAHAHAEHSFLIDLPYIPARHRLDNYVTSTLTSAPYIE